MSFGRSIFLLSETEELNPEWAIDSVLEVILGRTKVLGWSKGYHNGRGAQGHEP